MTKPPPKPESPFDSRPRIARTPIHTRHRSAETPLHFHTSTPVPTDVESPGFGVTGQGLLANNGRGAAEILSLDNGVPNDYDKQSKTSGVGSSIPENDKGILGVEVVGQGLLRLDKQQAVIMFLVKLLLVSREMGLGQRKVHERQHGMRVLNNQEQLEMWKPILNDYFELERRHIFPRLMKNT